MADETCKAKANGRKRSPLAGGLAAVSAGLALLACYGTTALIGLLSLVGVNLAQSETLYGEIATHSGPVRFGGDLDLPKREHPVPIRISSGG